MVKAPMSAKVPKGDKPLTYLIGLCMGETR
ncbi:hypothetical protein BH20ACT23_BH20ACT23_03770 [soil metagenome]